MLYDAVQQWLQINAYTSHCVVLLHLLQSGYNGRVKCKFLIDLEQGHIAFKEFLTYHILLKGPQIKVLAKSVKTLAKFINNTR